MPPGSSAAFSGRYGDADVRAGSSRSLPRVAHRGQRTAGFRPWIRLWAPNGAVLGDTSGLAGATITNALAPATGTYLILVSSFDSFFDGAGTYQLVATR